MIPRRNLNLHSVFPRRMSSSRISNIWHGFDARTRKPTIAPVLCGRRGPQSGRRSSPRRRHGLAAVLWLWLQGELLGGHLAAGGAGGTFPPGDGRPCKKGRNFRDKNTSSPAYGFSPLTILSVDQCAMLPIGAEVLTSIRCFSEMFLFAVQLCK